MHGCVQGAAEVGFVLNTGEMLELFREGTAMSTAPPGIEGPTAGRILQARDRAPLSPSSSQGRKSHPGIEYSVSGMVCGG